MIGDRRQPGGDSERGTVLVLFAMALTALLILSALVVDLGLLRAERRESQSAADISAVAAGSWLSGHNSGTAMSRPRSACEAVLAAAQANLEKLPAGATIDCSGLPAGGVSPFCTGTTVPVTATAVGAAPYSLTVMYPVPSSVISEPAFPGGVGIDDGAQCERMQVTIGYVQDSLLAGVLGISSVDTQVSAVVRGAIEPGGDKVPALLLLERTGCRTLANSAGGAGNLGLIVGAPSATSGADGGIPCSFVASPRRVLSRRVDALRRCGVVVVCVCRCRVHLSARYHHRHLTEHLRPCRHCDSGADGSIPGSSVALHLSRRLAALLRPRGQVSWSRQPIRWHWRGG